MKLCLIGERVSQSYSKEIHNIMGLDYSLVSLKKEELYDFIKNCEYNGFNVTMPYKKEVMKYLNEIDGDALKMGAVNVVNIVNGKLYGYNTDIWGMEYMLKRKGVSVNGKNVLILGTGGASSCAVALMQKLGANYTVVGRTSPVNYQNCYDLQETQIIINTTPVGMTPDLLGTPLDLTKFSKLEAVFDAVYNPQRTALIRQAMQLGVKCSGGISMLVEQALCGEDIWLSSSHTKTDSEDIILKLIKRKLNIALVGMPSSGKTTVGKALANALSRKFYDVDEVILEKTGKTSAEIIESQGEEEFRSLESQVVKELCSLSGVVIAMGGGSVLKEENRAYISANCVSVYVQRNLNLLKTNNRPISKSVGVEELFKQRKSLYEKADVTVSNNETVENTVKEIISKYEIACSKWS